MIISQLIDYLIDLKVASNNNNKDKFNKLKKELVMLGLTCDMNGNIESSKDNNLGKDIETVWTTDAICNECNGEGVKLYNMPIDKHTTEVMEEPCNKCNGVIQ